MPQFPRQAALLSIALLTILTPTLWAQDTKPQETENEPQAIDIEPDTTAKPTVPTTPRVLRVGTKEAAPFAFKVRGEWTGIAIELWRDIASDLGREFVIEERTIDGLFDGLRTGSLDITIGAISITAERESDVDFSHSFFGSGIGIATRYDEEDSWGGILDRLRSAAFAKAMGALLLALGIAASLVYIFERRRNTEEFGGTIPQGLGSSLWWSAVTMTTVGYGDKAPKTVGGRIVGGIWMFTSVVIVSTFTASIASSLTLTRLTDKVRGPEDLAGVRVAAISGSTSDIYLRSSGIRHQTSTSINESLQLLRDGKVDAVVHDRPVLQYLIGQENNSDLMILGHSLSRENYGFALPPNSPLREELNRSILHRTQGDAFKQIIVRYLGATQ